MSSVQFEEPVYQEREVAEKLTGLEHLIVSLGLVKNRRGAVVVMWVIFLVCSSTSVFFFFKDSFKEDPSLAIPEELKRPELENI